MASLTIQLYIFTTTRCLVRGEALLTQLLFDHALRLRMKDSLGEEDKQDVDVVAATPLIRIEEVVDTPAGVTEGLLMETTDIDSPDRGVEAMDKSGPASEATEVSSASSKGKADDPKPAETTGEKPSGQGLAGKINVLMAADVESILEGRDLALVFVYAPVQLVLAVWLLYRILSWSSLVGILTLIITLPIPGLLTKKNADFQQQRMLATDSRVDSITEAIGALRMIKMFGWEDRIKERIAVRREDELKLIWKRRLMTLATILLNTILPVLTMAITFAFYTLVEKRELTAAKVFTSMTVFELIKQLMGMSFYLTNAFVTAYVSMQRINKFLQSSEMIDEYAEGRLATIKAQSQLDAEEHAVIRIHDAVFTWGSPRGNATPGFTLHIPDVTFSIGRVNLITGPTGSGKSSLLKALIGELHFVPTPGSFFHLPRGGGVSYVAQESWCLSETIKDNILFGDPYDEARYQLVIHDCALEQDLKLFDDGDATEVGEKGVTLSGGQKARLTLARAVYAKSDIILMDDIFSALDALTSRWIIENLFGGSLIKGRTVLLITHHVSLAAPLADYVVALNADGSIRSAGPIEEGLLPGDLLEAIEESSPTEGKETDMPGEVKEVVKSADKLVHAEEKGEGRISRRALFSFFRWAKAREDESR